MEHIKCMGFFKLYVTLDNVNIMLNNSVGLMEDEDFSTSLKNLMIFT